MNDIESYVAHSQKKRIMMNLPGSAFIPVALMIPLFFAVGIWGVVLMAVWVAFLKYTDSRGYSFLGFYARKLRRYAGGYTARPRNIYNVDL